MPVLVDHSDDLACRGQFFLHHGLQRRIRLTIVHERADLRWRDVRELVVGRIRTTPDSMIDDDEDGSILSLGLFPGEILEVPGDDRTMFRFEAAWDSSLHNSLLLNRVTPSGETVYMTISAYLEVSLITIMCPIGLKCVFLLSARELLPARHHHQGPGHDCVRQRRQARAEIEASVPRNI